MMIIMKGFVAMRAIESILNLKKNHAIIFTSGMEQSSEKNGNRHCKDDLIRMQ